MLRDLLLEKSGLQWADRVIIYDEDGLVARVAALGDDKHVFQWISSAEELRYIYERDYRNSETQAVLIIPSTSIRIPFDIIGALTHAESRTSYAKVMHNVSDVKTVALLFAAVMLATKQQYMTWESFITHPAIFPFTINDVTQADMAAIPYLVMERMGEQIVFRIKENT